MSGQVKLWVIFKFWSIHQCYECAVGSHIYWITLSNSTTSSLSTTSLSLPTSTKTSIFSIILIYLLNVASCLLLNLHMWRKLTVDFVTEVSKILPVHQIYWYLQMLYSDACIGMCQEVFLEFMHDHTKLHLVGVNFTFHASIVSNKWRINILLKLIPLHVGFLLLSAEQSVDGILWHRYIHHIQSDTQVMVPKSFHIQSLIVTLILRLDLGLGRSIYINKVDEVHINVK